MARGLRFVGVAGLFARALDARAAEDGVIQLDPREGWLVVVVSPDASSWLSTLGHDHVVVATGWSGTVEWPAGSASCRVQIRVPVEGLTVDPPGARAFAGLGARELPDADRRRIVENLRGVDQLEASRFGEIRFVGTVCIEGPGEDRVEGELSVHGVTRPVVIRAEIDRSGGGLRARGGFTFQGSDFGITPFGALGGAIRNDDRLTILLDVGS